MFANSGVSKSADLATQTATPVPRANVAIRHTLDGVPFIVDSSLPDIAYVGDAECGFPHIPEFSGERIVDVVKWPWAEFSTANEPIRICVHGTPNTQGPF